MKSKEFAVAGAALTLVTYVLALSIAGQVFSAGQPSRTFPNSGTVGFSAIGVGVYEDVGCTSILDHIDWGVLEPGASKNSTCYVRNEGSGVSTLNMYTSNWSSPIASDYLTLSWDYGGQSIDVYDVVQVTFTLSVDASIEGITSFWFDITIVGNS